MRMGIDLGGTKIEGIVLDAAGIPLITRRIPTPANQGYAAILQAITQLVTDLETATSTRCTLGIGTPGAVSSQTGTMKNCNTTSLNGQSLAQDLARYVGRDVRIANDANCFALSEATDGAAAGCGVVFGVIMGTGVGGGVVIRGTVHNGPNAIAGEWGHTPLHADGPSCYCGRRGCVETYLSGPGLLADYRRHGGASAQDSAAIVQAAASGTDPYAVAAMDRYIDHFGRGLARVINILDPDAIVLGGGMSNIDTLYNAGIDAVTRHVFSDTMVTPILRNKFGDASGVRGAAWLW